MLSASGSSVAVSVSASQLIKLIKSVSSLVLQKRKVTPISCVFYEKRRLKRVPKKIAEVEKQKIINMAR